MDEVVRIAPLVDEPGLIAYECPACRYVTSVLWPPSQPRRQPGSCRDRWLKMKNPAWAAVKREAEEDWGDEKANRSAV
jgi:hypothetical protein